jgi:hypothetical protein
MLPCNLFIMSRNADIPQVLTHWLSAEEGVMYLTIKATWSKQCSI